MARGRGSRRGGNGGKRGGGSSRRGGRGSNRGGRGSSKAPRNKRRKLESDEQISDNKEKHPFPADESGHNVHHRVIEDRAEISDENVSSEEEISEDERNPFSELLNIFSSRKRKGQASDEDEDDEEEEDDEDEDPQDDDDDDDEVAGEDEDLDDGVDEEDEDLEGLVSDEEQEDKENPEEDEEEQEEDDNPEEEEEEAVEEAEDDDLFLKESDPFTLHFENEIDETLASKMMIAGSHWSSEKLELPHVGSAMQSWPTDGTKFSGSVVDKDIKKAYVKLKLCNQLIGANEKLAKVELKPGEYMTDLQYQLFSVVNTYRDLYYPERSHLNGEELRTIYCLHALNHVLKTRNRVIAHNGKIKSKKDDVPDEYRDQGFTRPKVLIVLPFRDAALRVVRMLIELMAADKAFVPNKERFEKEYGCEDDGTKKGYKPEDFETTFAGNIDDNFRIGIGVAKKSLKLYTEFYSSDIILASPLGLRTIIGSEGDEKRDFDFLSSIEILILDQTDVFLMQNWDHVLHLMSHMHQQPSDSHGVDFSRVRMWSINGWSKLYRQTLVFSNISTPEINSVFNRSCYNYAGKVHVKKLTSSGTICHVVGTLPQIFRRFEVNNVAKVADARFEFFTKQILPQLKDSSHVLIFVSSYFDFVRLRNYFTKEEINFCQLCEYTEDKKISTGRTRFFHGRNNLVLFTERFHFYRRYNIRGIKQIVFYELPIYPHFYPEICNMLLNDPGEKSTNECTVLYNKYDIDRIVPVTGVERAARLIKNSNDVYLFT